MLIKAKELAKGDLNTSLKNGLNNLENGPLEKVKTITAIYDQLGVKKMAQKEMIYFAGKAINALELVSVENSKKEVLKKFAEDLLEREH